jgi:ATP-dependent Clp protease ATP-binding subunit ClpA
VEKGEQLMMKHEGGRSLLESAPLATSQRWRQEELLTLHALREAGKTTDKIQNEALPHRSLHAIDTMISNMRYAQPYAPSIIRHVSNLSAQEKQNMRALHAQGLSEGQIAMRIKRATMTVRAHLRSCKLEPHKSGKVWRPMSDQEKKDLAEAARTQLAIDHLYAKFPGRTEYSIKHAIYNIRKAMGATGLPHKAWTQEEVEKLLALFDGGTIWREMTSILGRTSGACQSKLYSLRGPGARPRGSKVNESTA